MRAAVLGRVGEAVQDVAFGSFLDRIRKRVNFLLSLFKSRTHCGPCESRRAALDQLRLEARPVLALGLHDLVQILVPVGER